MTALETLAREPLVRDRIEQDVEAANQRFARITQVKRFAILDHGLTLAGGEMTPTLKIKRAVIHDHYREIFEGLYA